MNAALLKAKDEALLTIIRRRDTSDWSADCIFELLYQVVEELEQVVDMEIELARMPHTTPMHGFDLVAIARATAARAQLRELSF